MSEEEILYAYSVQMELEDPTYQRTNHIHSMIFRSKIDSVISTLRARFYVLQNELVKSKRYISEIYFVFEPQYDRTILAMKLIDPNVIKVDREYIFIAYTNDDKVLHNVMLTLRDAICRSLKRFKSYIIYVKEITEKEFEETFKHNIL